jgi:hypothetical protein
MLLLGIGWDCVKDIYKRYLAKNYGRSRLSNLRYIAIAPPIKPCQVRAMQMGTSHKGHILFGNVYLVQQ